MSVNLMSAIFEVEFFDLKDEEGNVTKASTAKLVLLAMADHANDEGEGAYPSIGRLARKTALSEQTIRNTFEALRHNGIIYLEGKSKYGTNNHTINTSCFPRAKEKEVTYLTLNPLDPQMGEVGGSNGSSQVTLPIRPESINHQLSTLAESEIKSISQSANRKVDAIIDIEKQSASKVNYPKREALPEPIRELIDAWVLASGIKPMAREISALLMEGQNWLNLKATGDDIKAAWEYAKANYPAPPSSPFGLTNTLRNYKAGNLKIKDEAQLQAPTKDGKGFYA